MKKIALEEHFLIPAFEEYWAPTVVNIGPAVYNRLHAQLADFGSQRIDAMDRAGIERSVLSLAGPGVQREPDTAVARRRAREVTDVLAREILKRPDRYSGIAHLPIQGPVSVKPDRSSYLLNQKAIVDIGAEYLFGKPVGAGSVRITEDDEDKPLVEGKLDASGRFQGALAATADRSQAQYFGPRRAHLLHHAPW